MGSPECASFDRLSDSRGLSRVSMSEASSDRMRALLDRLVVSPSTNHVLSLSNGSRQALSNHLYVLCGEFFSKLYEEPNRPWQTS